MTCNPHPDAPHGFDRNRSHDEGRYACDCESWYPPHEYRDDVKPARNEEWAARFSELPCCGHVAAVHRFGFCHSTAGMDPGEFCDCREVEP